MGLLNETCAVKLISKEALALETFAILKNKCTDHSNVYCSRIIDKSILILEFVHDPWDMCSIVSNQMPAINVLVDSFQQIDNNSVSLCDLHLELNSISSLEDTDFYDVVYHAHASLIIDENGSRVMDLDLSGFVLDQRSFLPCDSIQALNSILDSGQLDHEVLDNFQHILDSSDLADADKRIIQQKIRLYRVLREDLSRQIDAFNLLHDEISQTGIWSSKALEFIDENISLLNLLEFDQGLSCEIQAGWNTNFYANQRINSLNSLQLCPGSQNLNLDLDVLTLALQEDLNIIKSAHGLVVNMVQFFVSVEDLLKVVSQLTQLEYDSDLSDLVEHFLRLGFKQNVDTSGAFNSPQSDPVDSPPILILSDKLSDEARAYALQLSHQISIALKEMDFTLPKGSIIRIQHGRDQKDVRDGPDKGPYLVVVDENGVEQKKCTIFKTRVGNLRHFIALSTFISRLE